MLILSKQNITKGCVMDNLCNIHISKENEEETIASLKAWAAETGNSDKIIGGEINGKHVSLVDYKGGLDNIILDGLRAPIPASKESASLRVIPSNSGDYWIVKLDDDDWGLLLNCGSNLTQLEETDFKWAYLQEADDLSFIKDLKNLTHLTLQNHSSSSLSGLLPHTNLTSLRLVTGEIDDITALIGLPKLTSLKIIDNDILFSRSDKIS